MDWVSVSTAVGVNAAGLGLVAIKAKRVVEKRLNALETKLRQEYRVADEFVTGLLHTVNDRLGARATVLEQEWEKALGHNLDYVARKALLDEALRIPQRVLREASLARLNAPTKTASPADPFKQRYVNGRPSA